MEKTSIVKELKKVVEGMDLPLVFREKKYRWSFTAYHKTEKLNETKASVKFVGLYLPEEDKEALVLEMERRGFKFEFLKETYPPHPYFDGDYGNWGTSICFSSMKKTEHSIEAPFILDSTRLQTIRTLLLESKTEVVFTLEQVREHLKNVEEIQCLYDGEVYKFNPYEEDLRLFYKDYWIKNTMSQAQRDYFLEKYKFTPTRDWVWVKLTDTNKLVNIIR